MTTITIERRLFEEVIELFDSALTARYPHEILRDIRAALAAPATAPSPSTEGKSMGNQITQLPTTEEILSGSYTIPAEKLVGCSMIKPPEPVGYWVLYPQSTFGRTRFTVYHKPTPDQIKNTEELLGWGWEDARL